MKEFAKAFYWGKRWKTCKKSYIEKRILIDGGLCEECKKNLGYIVHHKIHLNEYNINDPEVSLNHSELEYVCKSCHDLFDGHGLNKKSGLLVRFDSDGQPVPIDDSPPNFI